MALLSETTMSTTTKLRATANTIEIELQEPRTAAIPDTAAAKAAAAIPMAANLMAATAPKAVAEAMVLARGGTLKTGNDTDPSLSPI
jgi:hypothetical protein